MSLTLVELFFSLGKIGVQNRVLRTCWGVISEMALVPKYSKIVSVREGCVGHSLTHPAFGLGIFRSGAFTPLAIALRRILSWVIFLHSGREFLGPSNWLSGHDFPFSQRSFSKVSPCMCPRPTGEIWVWAPSGGGRG